MVKSDADDDNFSNTDVNADCKCSYIIIPVINAVCSYNMLIFYCALDSNGEMLRLWEDLSVKYKQDYMEDRDIEYIKVSL